MDGGYGSKRNVLRRSTRLVEGEGEGDRDGERGEEQGRVFKGLKPTKKMGPFRVVGTRTKFEAFKI